MPLCVMTNHAGFSCVPHLVFKLRKNLNLNPISLGAVGESLPLFCFFVKKF